MSEQKPSYGVVDPDGVEPHADEKEMTDAQAAELRELCERLGEEYDSSLSKQQAEERLQALRARDRGHPAD